MNVTYLGQTRRWGVSPWTPHGLNYRPGKQNGKLYKRQYHAERRARKLNETDPQYVARPVWIGATA